MMYTDIQKAAIVSLLIEMINADGRVDIDELRTLNHINHELDITQDIFTAGRGLNLEAAISIAARMTDEQKLDAGGLLVRMIDADSNVDINEIALLNTIGERTGISFIVNTD